MWADSIASRMFLRLARYLTSNTRNRVVPLLLTLNTMSGTRSLDNDHRRGTSDSLVLNVGWSLSSARCSPDDPSHLCGSVCRLQSQLGNVALSSFPICTKHQRS